jgi:Hydrazine synthase alpha subunit middle domain
MRNRLVLALLLWIPILCYVGRFVFNATADGKTVDIKKISQFVQEKLTEAQASRRAPKEPPPAANDAPVQLALRDADSATSVVLPKHRYPEEIGMTPPPLVQDSSVRYDYDIVYVRSPRYGDEQGTSWPEIAHPGLLEPGADLMLLHPNGSEEVLFPGGKGAVTDPYVSFDARWVYFSYFPDLEGADDYHAPRGGADIFKLHVPSRRVVQLTHQELTPNTGAADWSSDFRHAQEGKTWLSYGVLNLGPCPLPGGRIAFVSSRNGFKPPKHHWPTLQLFVMDDDGRNVEQIGYLNIGMALHPTILTDGRMLFSSLESQGLRNSILWGVWSIHPDGTNWAPVVSAFDLGEAPNAFHFQTQLSDGSIVVEGYYNLNNHGFGTLFKMPLQAPEGYSAFGPGYWGDLRNPPIRTGRFSDAKPVNYRLPFSPFGLTTLTPFARIDDGPAGSAVLGSENSPRVGKFTHPSGAPDNHLLTVWSPGPVNRQNGLQKPAVDGGLYLLKAGTAIDEPGQLRLIKNDPRFNEQWPRALVPYERIYGMHEPRQLPRLVNDGKQSPYLPEGTPFGLIGTSSLYKRESYPNGAVPKDGVTATWARGRDSDAGYQDLDPFNTSSNHASPNWINQGADAGRYSNDDIHAIRILAMEPTTDREQGPQAGRRFVSHATERLRILGEIPVRKFGGGDQPKDPDGNPDTSFLARIPADVAFTFQTLDKHGMVLNMAQTWHQLRPGEIRSDCGGCHAHSQKPTEFADTAAARDNYVVFDLTNRTPLLTTKARDESGKKWNEQNDAGLRFSPKVANVEYQRDVRPIFQRSCAACHNKKSSSPAAGLVLDDDADIEGVPGTYFRLAMDNGDKGGRFGPKAVITNGTWRGTNASRYIRKFQSRRSLLVWKIFGERLDGWNNDDFPTETTPGDPQTLVWHGKPLPPTPANRNRADLDYTGSIMPPPAAVAGTYAGADGRMIRVAPLSDEDRFTLVRWIDLGCPLDLDYDAGKPGRRGWGWMADDNRPTLALTWPQPGHNERLTQIVLGMHDYDSGLDARSLEVRASFPVQGRKPGDNLAALFTEGRGSVWRLTFDRPIENLDQGAIEVRVRDRAGNWTRIERSFSVGVQNKGVGSLFQQSHSGEGGAGAKKTPDPFISHAR